MFRLHHLFGAAMVAAGMIQLAPSCLAQDAVKGQHVFRKCAVCHVADPKSRALLAPPLHDIVGRRAAQSAGFEYSEIMKTAGERGLIWTSQALYHFLDRPDEFMPGTYMTFAGLEAQERLDVIAYLRTLTAEPAAAGAAGAPPGAAASGDERGAAAAGAATAGQPQSQGRSEPAAGNKSPTGQGGAPPAPARKSNKAPVPRLQYRAPPAGGE